MNKEQKFNIYFGLLKSNMEDCLNKDIVIKSISEKLLKMGVIGFNVENIKGFWNGKEEPALKISFINTFGVVMKDIIKILENLKVEFSQESILFEEEQVLYNFV